LYFGSIESQLFGALNSPQTGILEGPGPRREFISDVALVWATDAGADMSGGVVGRVGDDIVDGLYVIACYYRVIIDCRVRRKTKIGGGED
jgi:hypothetical protein